MVTGCPKDKGAKNSVSGKVTLDGQPVKGTVIFKYADGQEKPSPLGPQGNYMIPDPPTGQVKILVRGMGGAAAPKGAEGPNAGTGSGVEPPSKYGDERTTDLTYEVKPGKHTKDLTLSK